MINSKRLREIEDLYRELAGLSKNTEINYWWNHNFLGGSATKYEISGNVEERININRMFSGKQYEEAEFEEDNYNFSGMKPEGRLTSITCKAKTYPNKLPDISTKFDIENRTIEYIRKEAVEIYTFLESIQNFEDFESGETLLGFLEHLYKFVGSHDKFGKIVKFQNNKGGVTLKRIELRDPAYKLTLHLNAPGRRFYSSPTECKLRFRKRDSKEKIENIIDIHMARLERIIE